MNSFFTSSLTVVQSLYIFHDKRELPSTAYLSDSIMFCSHPLPFQTFTTSRPIVLLFVPSSSRQHWAWAWLRCERRCMFEECLTQQQRRHQSTAQQPLGRTCAGWWRDLRNKAFDKKTPVMKTACHIRRFREVGKTISVMQPAHSHIGVARERTPLFVANILTVERSSVNIFPVSCV